jgi:hypothetical protein
MELTLMAKVAHQNDRKDNPTTLVDLSLDQAARAAGARAAAEPDRLAEAASGGRPEAAATLLEIVGDQTRHALEAATALARARNLTEVAQVQSDFLGGSLARIGRLNERTLALLRSGLTSLPTTSRR